MKTVLLFCLIVTCTNIYSQSILSDKIDASTNERIILTGTNPIYKPGFTNTVQVQSQLNVDDNAVTSYELNFTAENFPMQKSNNSPSNTCLLTDENGNVYNGELSNESAEFPSCKFSKDDFYKIVAVNVTDVQIITADHKQILFTVAKKFQSIIAQQAKSLLSRLNADVK